VIVETEFANVYDDHNRAASFAGLEFPGTYFLAYRDLPDIIASLVRGKQALDFGCGVRRSTPFMRRLGFDVVGVDIARMRRKPGRRFFVARRRAVR
jgi:hypothetical protein